MNKLVISIVAALAMAGAANAGTVSPTTQTNSNQPDFSKPYCGLSTFAGFNSGEVTFSIYVQPGFGKQLAQIVIQFGDGTSQNLTVETSQSFPYTYKASGTYTPTVVCTQTDGAGDSVTNTLNVTLPTTATATTSAPTTSTPVYRLTVVKYMANHGVEIRSNTTVAGQQLCSGSKCFTPIGARTWKLVFKHAGLPAYLSLKIGGTVVTGAWVTPN